MRETEEIKMATKFSIHEDVENVLEPTKRATNKVVVGGKNVNVFTDKQQQQQRQTLSVLNNIQLNSGRNTTSHAQKTVSLNLDVLRLNSISMCNAHLNQSIWFKCTVFA